MVWSDVLVELQVDMYKANGEVYILSLHHSLLLDHLS